MARDYDHKEIEKKWQAEWEKQKLYETPDTAEGKKNFYALVEFPYPSGDLHVGHWYAYAVPDAFVRMKRMQGFNVLYPFGYDCFGLPAENAALKRSMSPADWIGESVSHMRTQIKTMGAAFDWSREITTSSPEYYRWTQWLFLQFYKRGLAYRGKAKVNWCPKDQTVLANEQVIDGKCERCDTPVEQRELEQWFFKITDYANRLLADLEPLEWPRAIKESQKNWIGKSEGVEVTFDVAGGAEHVTVFTTRPDTILGVSFIVLAPEHPLVNALRARIENFTAIQVYAAAAQEKKDFERTAEGRQKTGILLSGVAARHPLTAAELPVYVADYVLASYGTGAVMGVPAHDERDRAFATAIGAPIGTERLMEYAEAVRSVGGVPKVTYKLRDWLISRQRYWGAPIPIVYDPEGKPHPIQEEHLPWLLPNDADYKPHGTSPLGTSNELVERTEKIFGKGWRPETDTMDGFVDNSWYFLRYLDPHNDAEFSSIEKQKRWMPIARYSGGAEHTTVHVLYSRFFTKALYDMGLTSVPEPYTVRLNRGIILAEDGRKMSKRWGNVVNPDEQVALAGADAVRTYLAFIGPYNEIGAFPWNTNGLIGVRRFLERIAGFVETLDIDEHNPISNEVLLHLSIKKIGDDIENMKFNTSVSQLMILSNSFLEAGKISKFEYETLLKLLAPFAPHITEELWHQMGHTTSIHLEPWPTYDEKKLVSDIVSIAIQVEGKTRGVVEVPRDSTEEMTLEVARKDKKIAQYMPKSPKRVVFVSNRVLNIIP